LAAQDTIDSWPHLEVNRSKLKACVAGHGT